MGKRCKVGGPEDDGIRTQQTKDSRIEEYLSTLVVYDNISSWLPERSFFRKRKRG